ncbi:BSD domain-containing protein 1-like [Scleropages formosus]|uniref:BSD domain-containing protein 1-like n=1 Tax=Scleropages formosus TaxID=113540 RepID=A0A0N8JVS8_SCLFO|nr:BSD domain-containing protein 1-like [Scleropages formosus]
MCVVLRDGGWWGSWLQQSYQAVKDKSAETYEFLKRDLAEFSSVVRHDTACSIVATASAVRSKLAVEGSSETTEKVKKSLSNILGVITDTLAPPPDKTIDCDVITLMATPAGTTEEYDSTKARLYSLQADPATYCNEPDGPPEQFDTWLSGFSLEEKKGEISELLVSSPSIRALYTKMVPAAVSHSEFWQRYFYKVFQLDQEEARRVALKQRAERTAHSEALGWEEEEEDEFLGASSASRLDFAHPSQEVPPRARDQATVPLVSTVPAEQEGDRCDPGSESVSLPTQLETRAHEGQVAPAPEELNQKLGEATLEEGEAGPGVAQRHGQLQGRGSGAEQAANASGREEAAVVRAPARPGSAREDGPQDLRVFELNSDSGKSTPSNNGQKGSSTDVSEDWEKDFDLDMTEEEVQLALSRVNATGELDDEDWENWD